MHTVLGPVPPLLFRNRPWTTSAADNGPRTATVAVRDGANATGRASITVTVAN